LPESFPFPRVSPSAPRPAENTCVVSPVIHKIDFLPKKGPSVKGKRLRSFLTFLGKAVVHEQNSDTWEFGKGAPSVKLYSVAVLQCCGVAAGRGKEVRGWR